MSDKPACPHCGADLRGKQIPEDYLRAGYYGAWDGSPRYYERTIGVEIPGLYDGMLFYQCPDCGGRWHRFLAFGPGARLHELAEPYVNSAAGAS